MCAKITGVDICTSFSLHHAAFLQKYPINRKLDVIEKNGFQILDSTSQNWLRPPIVVSR